MARIVIVEDNALVARLYENKLSAANHTVKVALDGATGFELIKEFKPHLVLLDLVLPKRSGIEIIRAIRKDWELTNVPILAYSSADESELQAARAAGATRVVSKQEVSSKNFFAQITAMLDSTRQWQIYPSNDTAAKNATLDQTADANKVKKRVLIVEDDRVILALVRNIIEKAGYETVTAEDGRAAYRILAADANFVCGIFDVQVPFISGPDLLRHMRSEKRLMRIPVMIMTADESVRVQLESISAGAAVFVPKPFERQAFESLFVGVVAKSREIATP